MAESSDPTTGLVHPGQYIEAPNPYHPRPGHGPSIFLAGGITGCPDWQRDARSFLAGTGLVVLNPRRSHYEPTAGAHEEQVSWEVRHLQLADIVMFWFPVCDSDRTVQPIALLELGAISTAAVRGEQHLVVGAATDYPRYRDIELQLRHRNPGLVLHRDLPATIDAVLAIAERVR